MGLKNSNNSTVTFYAVGLIFQCKLKNPGGTFCLLLLLAEYSQIQVFGKEDWTDVLRRMIVRLK